MPSWSRWCLPVVALLASGCASAPTPAPAQTAATPPPAPAKAAATPPPGGKEALAVIREIQAEPLRDDDEAKKKNTVVMRWLTESPDITVVVCAELLPLRDPSGPQDSHVFIQLMFAQAAYQIEHPGVAPNDEAVLTAGLGGAMRTYRLLLAAHPEQRNPAWDQLEAAERNGALSPHVQKVKQGCWKH
jgi:hypothetical protein